jgi:hypothetical protein
VVTRRPKRQTRHGSLERSLDVMKMEYQRLLDQMRHHHERLRRLEQMAAIEFQRTVEQQTEIQVLKQAVFANLQLIIQRTKGTTEHVPAVAAKRPSLRGAQMINARLTPAQRRASATRAARARWKDRKRSK